MVRVPSIVVVLPALKIMVVPGVRQVRLLTMMSLSIVRMPV